MPLAQAWRHRATLAPCLCVGDKTAVTNSSRPIRRWDTSAPPMARSGAATRCAGAWRAIGRTSSALPGTRTSFAALVRRTGLGRQGPQAALPAGRGRPSHPTAEPQDQKRDPGHKRAKTDRKNHQAANEKFCVAAAHEINLGETGLVYFRAAQRATKASYCSGVSMP